MQMRQLGCMHTASMTKLYMRVFNACCRQQQHADMGLHAGGALDVASGDDACLCVRPLQPHWMLGTLRRLQNHLLLQCQLSAVRLMNQQHMWPNA